MRLTARPPAPADLTVLLTWRNDPRVRNMSLSSREIDIEEHARWFDRMLAERSDQILVVEWDTEPVGVVQLEALDTAQATASWGCHLGEVEVPPGVGACLPLIGLGLGFGSWGLRRMSANVLGVNSNMLAMHRRFRIPEEGVRRQQVRRDDRKPVDVHEYGVLASEWPAVRERGLSLLPKQIRVDVVQILDGLDRAHPGRTDSV